MNSSSLSKAVLLIALGGLALVAHDAWSAFADGVEPVRLAAHGVTLACLAGAAFFLARLCTAA